MITGADHRRLVGSTWRPLCRCRGTPRSASAITSHTSGEERRRGGEWTTITLPTCLGRTDPVQGRPVVLWGYARTTAGRIGEPVEADQLQTAASRRPRRGRPSPLRDCPRPPRRDPRAPAGRSVSARSSSCSRCAHADHAGLAGEGLHPSPDLLGFVTGAHQHVPSTATGLCTAALWLL